MLAPFYVRSIWPIFSEGMIAVGNGKLDGIAGALNINEIWDLIFEKD